MKRWIILASVILIVGLLIGSCNMLPFSDQGLDSTRVALAIQQTSLAMGQADANQVEPATVVPELPTQPTYTPYPTYTARVEEPTAEVETPPEEDPAPTQEQAPAVSFEDWMEDVDILLYDDMLGQGEPPVVENAIDGLGLGTNTTNVGNAMGDFLSRMNSAVEWDLIIVAAESRDSISGEYFDVLVDQIDRGTSMILEIWYIDDIFHGRIQPVMQRCGITFHRDWWRDNNSNLNEYLVYLLEPGDPMFSQPNTISMLIPYDVLWIGDVGDQVELIPGSNAVLLAGTQPKEHRSYGLVAECLDGRMVWQLYSTHDYKTQEMINMWQNYIYNTLQARYEYLQ